MVSDNTLQLLIGWELVGLCSFMLIGHWWEEGVNSSAAIKAFITTRTGDVGLMLGIITLFFAAGATSTSSTSTSWPSPAGSATACCWRAPPSSSSA